MTQKRGRLRLQSSSFYVKLPLGQRDQFVVVINEALGGRAEDHAGVIVGGVGPPLTSPSYLVRNRTLGPPLENNPESPPSSRDEGLRLLHGLETNLATSLQTPQEA